MSTEVETNTVSAKLDDLHHLAMSVDDIAKAVDWYASTFSCLVRYQDDTWALLQFANLQLALVIAEQHPPHVAFARTDAERFGALKTHRDGTRSCYIRDPAGNAVEIMDAASL